MTRCNRHEVDTTRTHGWCAGCEADRNDRWARSADAGALSELQRAVESVTAGTLSGERYHRDVAAELSQTAFDLDAVARQCRETLAICQQLDELGPFSHECDGCDDDAVAERDRVAREDYVAWLHGVGD
jgi:hypothetical protein